MIFKNLFTPKWKHPKTQVRAAALDKLDVAKDGEIISVMAKQDSAPEIRRQALNKLNNIGLWWHAFKQDQALKELAEQQIVSAVINNELGQEPSIKDEYIDKHATPKFLERLVFVESNTVIKVKLLKRLSNASLIEKAFREGDASLQSELLDLVEQHQLFKSALKHAKGDVKSTIEAKLFELKQAEEMPAKIAADVKLVLAKLNYLREKSEFTLVSDEFNALKLQWNSIELNWLPEAEVTEVGNKFTVLCSKLDTHVARLEADYLAQVKHQQAVEELNSFEQNVQSQFSAIKLRCENIAGLITGNESSEVSAELDNLLEAISLSTLTSTAVIARVKEDAQELRSKLQALPAIAVSVESATQAIAQLKQVEAATEVAELDARLSEFEQVRKAANNAVKAIPKAFIGNLQNEIRDAVKTFNAAIAPLLNDQKERLQAARKKALDTKRLIENGRFNVAFGVFKGFISEFEQLTAAYQSQLESLKEELAQRLEELQDWQKYATAPKRDEILAELGTLVGETANPAERAKQVKQLRTRWSECGPLSSEEDNQKSELFESLIEKAFEPCRAYFAEQEALREQNEQVRRAIIARTSELSITGQTLTLKELESALQSLKQEWKDAGKVNQELFNSLSMEFKAAQDSVWTMIKGYYEANSQAKQAILAEATIQSEESDLQRACENLKVLQQKWQTIGFAGAKNEHKLWQAFRAINDAVFAKRQAQAVEYKAQQSQLLDALNLQLDELEAEFKQADNLAVLNDIAASLKSLNVPKVLRSRVQEFDVKLQSELTKLLKALDKSNQTELLDGLKSGQLPERWKKAGASVVNPDELLIKLEILVELDSPTELAQQRSTIKISMLEEKLSGSQPNAEEMFKSLLNSIDLPVSETQLKRIELILDRL